MNKKFALLLVLLAAMVMGSVASASAADVKATGTWTISADWMSRSNFSETETSTFALTQRMRTGFQFVASQNLKAVLDTQIGSTNWGQGVMTIGSGRNTTAGGGSGNNNGAAVMLRNGYLDFTVPSTKVKVLAGYQSLSLPSAVGGGSPILDDHFGAVAAVVPVMDSLSFVGGFGRALDGGNLAGSKSALDLAFLIADVTPMKGVNVKPYAAYAYNGAKSGLDGVQSYASGLQTSNASLNSGARIYYGGIAAEVSVFDPIKVMADFHYGKATYGKASAANTVDGRAGWMFDLQVDYTGLSMMTPSLIYAYSSGESDNNNGSNLTKNSKRMPVVGPVENYALTSFFMQGSNSLNADTLGGNTNQNLGFWVLGAQLRDIKLIEKLSHTLGVFYFKGTNDPDYVRFVRNTTRNNVTTGDVVYGKFLTTKDSLWEVDLNTKYDIYNELAAHVQLGYINPSFNKTVWTGYQNSGQGNKDAYKATFTLTYSF